MFLPSDGLVAAITPTIDTAAYATGDLLAAPTRIENAVLNTKGLSRLSTLLILDAANQKSAMDILFFDRDPGSLGALNAAVDISTLQLSYLVGFISIASADYVTLKTAANAVAIKNPNIVLPARVGAKDFWMAIISRGSPDYVTASDLVIKLILERQQ